jgi:hypothetical protein
MPAASAQTSVVLRDRRTHTDRFDDLDTLAAPLALLRIALASRRLDPDAAMISSAGNSH